MTPTLKTTAQTLGLAVIARGYGSTSNTRLDTPRPGTWEVITVSGEARKATRSEARQLNKAAGNTIAAINRIEVGA